jgi:hypothetical protein
MPVGGSDFGTLPPYGTSLSLANEWIDGAVQYRSGSSLTINAGATFTNNTPSTLTNQASTPATPTGAAVLYSTSGGVLAAVSPTGQVTTIGGVVQAQTSTVTVANTAAATALTSYMVPANDPAAGAVYSITGYGVYSWTGTPTIQFILYWGGTAGTALATIPTVTLSTAQTGAPFSYSAMVTCRSATSFWSNLTLNLDTTTLSDNVATYTATPTTATTVTSTASEALTVGVTWGTGASANTISLVGGVVERIA